MVVVSKDTDVMTTGKSTADRPVTSGLQFESTCEWGRRKRRSEANRCRPSSTAHHTQCHHLPRSAGIFAWFHGFMNRDAKTMTWLLVVFASLHPFCHQHLLWNQKSTKQIVFERHQHASQQTSIVASIMCVLCWTSCLLACTMPSCFLWRLWFYSSSIFYMVTGYVWRWMEDGGASKSY